MKPRGFKFRILYGLCKVHKQFVDNYSPFRAIMSAIKTPTYHLAKFLVHLLDPITTNMYIVKTTFEFAKEMADPRTFHGQSGSWVPLYQHTPLEETISVCCDSLLSNDAKVDNINRIDFEKNLKSSSTKELFQFRRKNL